MPIYLIFILIHHTAFALPKICEKPNRASVSLACHELAQIEDDQKILTNPPSTLLIVDLKKLHSNAVLISIQYLEEQYAVTKTKTDLYQMIKNKFEARHKLNPFRYFDGKLDRLYGEIEIETQKETLLQQQVLYQIESYKERLRILQELQIEKIRDLYFED